MPQQGAIPPPPWCLVLHRHISVTVIHRFATYRAILVRYPRKGSTKKFCDANAESITRYEKVSLLGLLAHYHLDTDDLKTVDIQGRWGKSKWGLSNEQVLGPDIRRTSTRISRRTSGGKNFGPALERNPGKISILVRTSMSPGGL